jgi:glycosyltransferase involved in cell wall biosynthesis
VDALYAAMLRFVENPDLIEKMGSASRRLVEQRFNVRRVNKLLLDEMKIS